MNVKKQHKQGSYLLMCALYKLEFCARSQLCFCTSHLYKKKLETGALGTATGDGMRNPSLLMDFSWPYVKIYYILSNMNGCRPCYYSD